MWGDANMDEVRAVWAERLALYAQDIGPALTAMERVYRDYPPTLPQFTELCRDAAKRRTSETKRIEGPRTEMPKHIREHLSAFVKSKGLH